MPTIEYSYHPVWNVLNAGSPYEPFPWQSQHIHAKVDEGYTRIIAACGRRSGKSTAVVAEVAREVVKPAVEVRGVSHAPVVYIIGPTAEASMRVWEPVWNAFVPSDSGSYTPPLGFLYEGHDKNRGVIYIKGGGRIYRKTADDPRSLQGERVTLAIPDEAHDTNEEAWANLMPALLDSGGRLIAIGVPKGRGRFRSYWHLGQGLDSQFYSSSVPTTISPIIRELAARAEMGVEEWLREEAAGDLTDNEFRQQYLAEWVDEDGQVFSGYEHLFTELPGYPFAGGTYVMGLDLGKLHDYTVLYVGDVATGKLVYTERFNKIDYLDQAPRIARIAKAWNVRYVHMDNTGIGSAVYEMLVREGVSVIPYVFTNQSKQALVSTMVREVERGNVRFLKDDEVLKKEMALFEGTVSPGGVIKYSAPPGYHDDAVIAAALCIYKMSRNRRMAGSPLKRSYFGIKSSQRVAA